MMRVRQTPSFKYRPSQSVGNQLHHKLKPHTRGSARFEPGKDEIFSGSGPVDINLTHSGSHAYRD